MVDYLYLAVSCALSVEIIIRLRFISHIGTILKNIVKALKIITSANISDHWKEKMIPVYALIILKKSLKILWILSLIIFVFSILSVISSNFLEFIFSSQGILLTFLVSFAYFKYRVTKNE